MSPARRAPAAVAIAAALLLAGCSTSMPTPASPSHSHDSSLRLPGRAGCAPPSPITLADAESFPEVQATGSGTVTAYGLIMGAEFPLVASQDVVKVVWRVTGSGAFGMKFTDPAGVERPLVWGPEFHQGSSYDRPGEEWGTGFTVDAPGCWQLTLARGNGTAQVWLDVG